MRSLAALLDTTIRVYNLVTFPSKEDPEELIYPDDAKKDGIFINIIHNPAGYHILYKGEMNI